MLPFLCYTTHRSEEKVVESPVVIIINIIINNNFVWLVASNVSSFWLCCSFQTT